MAPARRSTKLTVKAMANKAIAEEAAAAKTAKANAKAVKKSALAKLAANTSAKMAPKTAKAAGKAKAAASNKATKAAAAPKTNAEPQPAPMKIKEEIVEPAPAPAPTSKKRKSEGLGDVEEAAPRPIKKLKSTIAAPPKTPKAQKAAPVPKAVKVGPAINQAPTQKLVIYVFGEGTLGELGMGSVCVYGKQPINVERPCLNGKLSDEDVGIVQLASGGMHCAALTHQNKILTWGVNDQGALGRDTKWEGVLKVAEENDDDENDSGSDNDETGMNPMESNPATVGADHFPDGTKFVQLVASDSATFALTEDGSVYGWGTFRDNEGVLGFTEKIKVQTTPMKLPELQNIKLLAAGSNHVLALDQKGTVFGWGAGQQYQLGRRVSERTRTTGLVPRQIGLPKNKTTYIACGAYHSFAVGRDGQVWAWGLNNFGETGISEGAGDDNAVIVKPTIVTELGQYMIREIQGGEHHTVACTVDGQLLTWGRVDGSQIGVKISDISEEDLIRDERGRARITKRPIVVPGIHAVAVAAGSHTGFAVDKDGKAYSWGFNANYRTGQGTDDGEIEVATLMDSVAIRDERLVGAGAGGQYGVLMAIAEGN